MITMSKTSNWAQSMRWLDECSPMERLEFERSIVSSDVVAEQYTARLEELEEEEEEGQEPELVEA